MKKKTLLIFTFIFLLTQGQSSVFAMKHYVFEDQPPVSELGDKQPSAVPEKTDYDLIEYFITASGRYPVIDSLDARRIKRSQDVNSMDDVPASSWYTPRNFKNLNASEIVRGPEKVGPPEKPFKIVKAKTSGTGNGFMIEDNRGHRYLIKFDEPDMPNTESTANFVVSRLFWALGYHVPEDHLFFFDSDDFTIELKNQEEQDQVDIALFSAMLNEEGLYRTTASLLLQGEVLGHIPSRGTRRGDINDRIAHQNLRVLRALYIFCAWTNNSGIREDNTLDVYEGAPGEGHTVHYMIDFGESLGIHGRIKNWSWDGFEHYFSFGGLGKYFLTLGSPRNWESIDFDKDDDRAYYEAESFDPSLWKEVVHFLPIRYSQPDDHYWALKKISLITEDHLRALFRAAKHPDQAEVDYWIETLLKRRQALYRYHLKQVSPLESKGVIGNSLQLNDEGKNLLGSEWNPAYFIQFYNQNNKRVASDLELRDVGHSFEIPLSHEMFEKAKGYLRVEVVAAHSGDKRSPAAEFHLRGESPESAKLVGVVH